MTKNKQGFEAQDDALSPPEYRVPMWARVLAASVVGLELLVAFSAVYAAANGKPWPLTLENALDVLFSFWLVVVFAWVAAGGRVSRVLPRAFSQSPGEMRDEVNDRR